MPSSLFSQGQNGIFARVDALRRMVGGDPDAALQRMMRNNPQLAEFVSRNRGKTPEQIAADYGVDISLLRRLM